jgi:hypothetical protein
MRLGPLPYDIGLTRAAVTTVHDEIHHKKVGGPVDFKILQNKGMVTRTMELSEQCQKESRMQEVHEQPSWLLATESGIGCTSESARVAPSKGCLTRLWICLPLSPANS